MSNTAAQVKQALGIASVVLPIYTFFAAFEICLCAWYLMHTPWGFGLFYPLFIGHVYGMGCLGKGGGDGVPFRYERLLILVPALQRPKIRRSGNRMGLIIKITP